MKNLFTPDDAARYLREAFPDLVPRVGNSQISFWLSGLGRRGRVVRVAQDGDIKRTATALRLGGNAVAGFDDRLPLAEAYLDALVVGELRVLRHEAKLDPALEAAVREIDAILASHSTAKE